MQLEAFQQDVSEHSGQNVPKLKAIQAAIVELNFRHHTTVLCSLNFSKGDRSECIELFDTPLLGDPLRPWLFKSFEGVYANLGKLLREQ